MKKVLEYVTNLCYSLFRIGCLGVKNMKKNGILDAKDLAEYIRYKYFEKKKREISPIKLQKSLYFLFAYWGGMIRKSTNNPDYVEEDLSTENEILYDNEIQAWVYGPVVPDVYRSNKSSTKYDESKDIFKGNKFLEETINSILQDIFDVPDFKLVSISHEDKCWQDSFDENVTCHNNEIEKESIIKEYASRECI